MGMRGGVCWDGDVLRGEPIVIEADRRLAEAANLLKSVMRAGLPELAGAGLLEMALRVEGARRKLGAGD